MYVTTSGVNPSGLGCWSWHLLEGEEGYHTRVVTSYAPCDSTESRPDTYYQQKLRYITKKALKTTPKHMFQEDLGPIHSTEEMESKRGQGNTRDRCKQGCTWWRHMQALWKGQPQHEKRSTSVKPFYTLNSYIRHSGFIFRHSVFESFTTTHHFRQCYPSIIHETSESRDMTKSRL